MLKQVAFSAGIAGALTIRTAFFFCQPGQRRLSLLTPSMAPVRLRLCLG
jgi:hypothetical protein